MAKFPEGYFLKTWTLIFPDLAVDSVKKNAFQYFGTVISQLRIAGSVVRVGRLRPREVVVAKSAPDDIVYLTLLKSKFLLPMVLSYRKNAFSKSKKNWLTLSSVPHQSSVAATRLGLCRLW